MTEISKDLYETLSELVPLARDAVEADDRNADTYEARKAVVDGKVAILRAEFYLEEFRERYEGGNLD